MINRSADVNQPKQDGKERTYGDFINFAEIEKIGLRAICIIGLAFRGDGPELTRAKECRRWQNCFRLIWVYGQTIKTEPSIHG